MFFIVQIYRQKQANKQIRKKKTDKQTKQIAKGQANKQKYY